MTTATLPDVEPTTDVTAEIEHIFCPCDPEMSLCGLPVDGELCLVWPCVHPLCDLCERVADLPCVNVGCDY